MDSKENLSPPGGDEAVAVVNSAVTVNVEVAPPTTEVRPSAADMKMALPSIDIPALPTSSSSSTRSLAQSPSSASSAQAITDILQEINTLSKENRLLESIIIRNDENAAVADDISDDHLSVAEGNDDTSTNAPPALTAAERSDLVVDELVYRRAQSASLQTKFQLDMQLLESITTAITTRIGSLRKEAFSFQREVCMNGLNRDGFVRADIIAHWLDNTLKTKQNELHHYTAKINSLKTAIHKQEQSLQNKTNTHDSLHSIDFHQLQIKNTQFTTKIKEKNQTLLTLKLSTGKAVHRLTDAKRILSNELIRTNNLTKEMTDRTRQLARLSDERIRISSELIKAQNKTQTYQCVVSNPNMPTVMDYVLLKKNLYELLIKKKELIRKNEIMKGRERSQQQVIRRQQQRALTAPSVNNNNSSLIATHPLIYHDMTATRPLDNRLPRI